MLETLTPLAPDRRGSIAELERPPLDPDLRPLAEDPTAALLAARGRLRAFVERRSPAGVEPEDVVQEVLARLLGRAGEIPPGKAQAWALTSARNALIDLHRRRRAAPLDVAAVPAPAAPEDDLDLAACLRPLLDLLSPEDRALLEQVDARGRAQADLARELGLAPSTVKSRVQRARRRLRAIIEACCELELDARGVPIDARRRARGPCGDPARPPGSCA